MDQKRKLKRRGFVMTGGGAKGLYEAGVINAFHLTGLRFDVITGSSIGAMNSIFFAEYLLRRKSALENKGLGPDLPNDPGQALDVINEMETLIRCYHHTWLQMPTEKLIDDGKDGALSKLVKQLGALELNLSDLITLGWWSTDPQLKELPVSNTGGSLLTTLNRLITALGNGNAFKGLAELTLILMKYHNKQEIIRQILSLYLKNINLQYSIIPDEGDRMGKIEAMFTRKVSPLETERLAGAIDTYKPSPPVGMELVQGNRTLKDYRDAGIDVRLTRANYRTGRLEVSAYLSAEDFRRYMKKQAWRMMSADRENLPLGSFRLQVPGNPGATKAALASGRFPGVFPPFPFTKIYDEKDPENALLYQMISNGNTQEVSGEDVQRILSVVAKSYNGSYKEADSDWNEILNNWQASTPMREFFPHRNDTYVDGGSIDNTPSNSAVDATREWLEGSKVPRRDAVLELYVIFLEKEPRISSDQASQPLLYEVVQRTLAIQSAAVKSSDAVVVNTINTFGQRGDELARALLAVLDGLEKSPTPLAPGQLENLEACIKQMAPGSSYRYQRSGDDPQSVLASMKAWTEDMLATRLPLHVDEVKIYPDDMTLSTLQFTERLGYKQENAIGMITMGCYNTLETIGKRLKRLNETSPSQMDDQDRLSLALINKWMRDETGSSRGWACMRTECVFHQNHCIHGLDPKA
jgi:predicted acylesterase/phospholipase RssA